MWSTPPVRLPEQTTPLVAPCNKWRVSEPGDTSGPIDYGRRETGP